MTVLFGTEAQSVRREADGVHLSTGTGADLVVDEVLVATGRRPRTSDLGLETLGLEPGKALTVDDALQVTGVDGGWLFAVGDVSGRTATTHQGKYDARVVGDVIAARFDPRSSAADSPEGATAGDRSLAPTTSAPPRRGAATGRPRTSPPCRRSCSRGPRSRGSG